VLDRTARDSQDSQVPAVEQIQSLVSDAILDQFSLVRDSSGQVQRRLLFATLGGLPNAHS
jgi:hypothetical protein